MDLKQLETWIETTEGKKWLDSQKEGLLKKNEELIKELKTAGGSLSELTQRVTDTEKQLETEKAAIRQALLVQPLQNSLTEKVFPVILPHLMNELCETYGLAVKAASDGTRAAIGTVEINGTKVEKTLSEIVDHWTQTDGAKSYLIPQPTTVVSTCIAASGKNSQGQQQLDGLTGRELAAMTEQDFQSAVKGKLGQ
jgi:hypothetical protein